VPEGPVKYLDALEAQAANVTSMARVVAELLDRMPPPAPRRPVLIGMGASYAALGAAEHALRARGGPAQRVVASDFDRATFEVCDLVVALSQSGKSRETIEAVQSTAVPALAVVNIAGSPLARACASTLAFGPVPDSLASTADLTGALAGHSSVDVIGSGGYSGAAEAGALLLRETSTMPTAAFGGRQYLHGPMEAGPGVGHLVIGQTDAAAVAAPLAARGHPVIIISAVADPAWTQPGVWVITLPAHSLTEEYVFTAILLQDVAAALSAERSTDPDDFGFISPDTKVEAAAP
jgi:fructoselysine-6-P-deglycase FrlB-like protein